MDVATLLRTARLDAGLSLRALATRAGTSHSTLAAYEQHRKVPRIDTLERILEAAGCAAEIRITTRPGRRDPAETAAALRDVLRLADAYPHQRTGALDAPVFGRAGAGGS